METVLEESKRRFAQDTANHTIDIRHDDGLYRHLVCTNGGSSIYRFDIVTYPGYLVVCGDMGEWVFTRLPDMFELFRSPGGGINPGYWAEKCRAGETSEFSEDKFKKTVTEYIRQYYDENFEEEEREAKYEEVMQAVREEVGNYQGHQFFSEFVHYFEYEIDREKDPLGIYTEKPEPFQFTDTFDMSFTEYKSHFLWALHGIVWAINEYDRIKEDKS